MMMMMPFPMAVSARRPPEDGVAVAAVIIGHGLALLAVVIHVIVIPPDVTIDVIDIVTMV
jgi:hypothetical protein